MPLFPNILIDSLLLNTAGLRFSLNWLKTGTMKKTHIILLVGIAAVIVALISFSADFSTYDTIQSAREKQGQFVHVIAKLDKTRPVDYNPVKDPNFSSFYAVDSLGGKTKVIYRNALPGDLTKSERIVMTGEMQTDHFECKDILLKCPSKYKDDKQQLEKETTERTSVTLN